MTIPGSQVRLAQIVEALARLEEQKTALLNERSALLQQSMAHQAQYFSQSETPEAKAVSYTHLTLPTKRIV